MDRKKSLSLTPFCFLALMSQSLSAAELIALDESKQEIASRFVVQLDAKAMLAEAYALRMVESHQDAQRKWHLRLQQYYQGVPVFGGYAIFHGYQSVKALVQHPKNRTINGVLYHDIEKDLGPQPTHYNEQGLNVLSHFLATYKDKAITEQAVKPIIYMDAQSKAHWAYQLTFLAEDKDSMPERPVVIVDAKTNQVYMRWNEIKTLWSYVKGRGFGGNLKTGILEYGKDLPYLELTRESSLNKCYMENLDVKIVHLHHKKNGIYNAMSFDCPQNDSNLDVFWTGVLADGYDKINGAFSPTNDALYTGYVIKHLYKDWYGLDVLKTEKNLPMQLVMRVHYGQLYENAFWDGRQMTFGDGNLTMYPLVSLGIGAHEISHGFTEQHSGLIYHGQSGAMNESFSDMAAQAALYYATGTNDWQIGAEVMKQKEALRYMDHPNRDGVSIESAADYKPYLDVHHASGVYNRLFYVLATKPQWDTRKAFNVMLKANKDYWIPYETFLGGACGLLRATEDLGYSLDDVKVALKEVGIHQRCAV